MVCIIEGTCRHCRCCVSGQHVPNPRPKGWTPICHSCVFRVQRRAMERLRNRRAKFTLDRKIEEAEAPLPPVRLTEDVSASYLNPCAVSAWRAA